MQPHEIAAPATCGVVERRPFSERGVRAPGLCSWESNLVIAKIWLVARSLVRLVCCWTKQWSKPGLIAALLT